MKPTIVVAVSGGPDSVYLLKKLAAVKGIRIVVGHLNYRTRGIESMKDQVLVENIGKIKRYETVIHTQDAETSTRDLEGASETRGNFPPGFEKKARDIRYRFLRDLSEKVGAEAIALAHTADDQVETILMRIFEGAGIGGLKGIPRVTAEGVVRPILDVWKEDIIDYLKKRKIPYRIDRSNADTRFERNWIRHALLPLLVKRYGKAVKKRIFALGERFRELDDYLEAEAGRWIRRHVESESTSTGRRTSRTPAAPSNRVGQMGSRKGAGRRKEATIRFRRKPYSALPTVLRRRVLQRICFERLGVAPNERLLKAMDGNVTLGGPSARVNAGKGWMLANRNEEALFLRGEEIFPSGSSHLSPILLDTPGEYEVPAGPKGRIVTIAWMARWKTTPVQASRVAARGDAEIFDAAVLALPLAVRPLRPGDRIRPFGGNGGGAARGDGKKVKEILIDRKVPREERWGRPVVCDADGAILWIPGVLRSAHAPVTPETRKAVLLRIRSRK